MNPKLTVHITPRGIEPIEIQAAHEQEQAVAEELLERIRPCFDVADAIIKKMNSGLQG
ncbi:MAG: hypothetical protein IH856_22205 [Deltaproteobacteria bacterium]|nr:hypothetical protein [Deltaproteobacteria bacterium]